MNLWKDIPTFPSHGDDRVNSVIEISKDTNTKYEYDIELGVIKFERCLISAMRYPCNYGFIPQTLGDDGDPLDIIVSLNESLIPGTVITGRVLGALNMNDKGKKDYKILVAPDFIHSRIASLSDLDPLYLDVIADFFSHYKNVTKSDVKVYGWLDKSTAVQIIQESRQAYVTM